MVLRGILRLYHAAASHKIQTHRELLDLVDQRLEEDLVSMEEKEAEMADHMDPEAIPEYEAYLADRHQERQELKSIFLSSWFVGSFALFEHEMVRICERARRETDNPISVRDFGGRDYLENTKKYLKKMGMALPLDTAGWKEAISYRAIRNKIMHEGSTLGEDDGILKYAQERGIVVTINLGEDLEQHELRLTKEFCDDALTNFNAVLRDMNVAYGSWKTQREVDAL